MGRIARKTRFHSRLHSDAPREESAVDLEASRSGVRSRQLPSGFRFTLERTDSAPLGQVRRIIRYGGAGFLECDSTQTLRNAMESLDTGGNPGQQVRRHLKKNLEMAP